MDHRTSPEPKKESTPENCECEAVQDSGCCSRGNAKRHDHGQPAVGVDLSYAIVRQPWQIVVRSFGQSNRMGAKATHWSENQSQNGTDWEKVSWMGIADASWISGPGFYLFV